MGVLEILRIVQGGIDVISGYRVYGGTRSIKHVAKKLGATYRVETNINAKEYVQHVHDIAPDLIISYSAPQVVKPELLSIPKYGVINVHGALLPNYRGILPSFWYLYNDEKIGGATVHKMSTAIDDGDIIEQDSVEISDCRSMFDLMKKTKLLGGELMVKTIKEYESGNVHSRINDTEHGSYYTWPTTEEAKEFKRRGKRLV
jgi:methionyl-tRNA formyltransferase